MSPCLPQTQCMVFQTKRGAGCPVIKKTRCKTPAESSRKKRQGGLGRTRQIKRSNASKLLRIRYSRLTCARQAAGQARVPPYRRVVLHRRGSQVGAGARIPHVRGRPHPAGRAALPDTKRRRANGILEPHTRFAEMWAACANPHLLPPSLLPTPFPLRAGLERNGQRNGHGARVVLRRRSPRG